MRVEELVGSRIRDIRDRQGMTQEQLGQAIGELLGKPWPRQTVSSAEAGRRAFTAAELVAVARALGVYVGTLFTPHPKSGIELSPGVELGYEDVMGVGTAPAKLDPDLIDAELAAQIAETLARLQEAERQHQEAWGTLNDLEVEAASAQVDLDQKALTVGWLQKTLDEQQQRARNAEG